MEMKWRFFICSIVFVTFIFGHWYCFVRGTIGQSQILLASKESRRTVVYTKAKEIPVVDVSNGRKDFGSYHLEFFILDTRTLLLSILLHANMVFYVHTGRGNISWIDKNKVEVLQVEPGDMSRLEEGTIFYNQSSGDPNKEKLRIHIIFNTCGDDENPSEPFLGGAYSNIVDLVRGFHMKVFQMSIGVSVKIIEEIKRIEKPPLIIPLEVKSHSENHNMDWREGIFEDVLGMRAVGVLNENHDKKAFNIFKRKPDVENSHCQSIALTHKDEISLKDSSMGVFKVNLTKRSMIGPHRNPKTPKIAIIIKGHGIVQVICPSYPTSFGYKKFNTKRLYVKEDDVFIIKKFYPMIQMSFNNSSFVFVGFNNNGREEEIERKKRDEKEDAKMRKKGEEAQRKWEEDEHRAKERREQEEEARRKKREDEARRERGRKKEKEQVREGERKKGKHRADVKRKSKEEKDEAHRREKDEETEDGKRKMGREREKRKSKLKVEI